MRIFSYIVAHDYGLAPNPFWGTMSLTVCKPVIRRTAEVGDWIIGTGSKNVVGKDGKHKDYSGKLVFAMKVDKIMSLKDYDEECCKPNSELRYKRPHFHLLKNDWRHKVGDCIYNYSEMLNGVPALRKMIHMEEDKETDLSGINALLSNHFYYFGNNVVKIQDEQLVDLVKKEQGHKILDDNNRSEAIVISKFIDWITSAYEVKKEYGKPQLYWDLDEMIEKKKKCSKLKQLLPLD
jgi:Zn-dependent metalloprotease